jgi:hypothetical protein
MPGSGLRRGYDGTVPQPPLSYNGFHAQQPNPKEHEMPRFRPRRHGTGLVASALFTVTLFTTACSGTSSGTGVASLGSSSASAPSSPGGGSAVAFSRCMRAHGIKDFPDPGSNGAINLNGAPGSDLNQNDPRFQAADQACKSLLPPGQTGSSGQLKTANLNYAKCMRAHGISDFPDPNADGSLSLKPSPGSDLDPSNPQYKNADNACKHYRLGGGTVTGGNGGGA